MDKFRNLKINLHNGRIISKPTTKDPMYPSPIEQMKDLVLNNDLKLELVNTFCVSFKGETNTTLDDFFIHFGDK
jgi:hypothetical protein